MSADEFAALGFAPGVVVGARSFKVDSLGRLTGIHYEQVWRPGENQGECRKREDDWGGGLISGGIYSSLLSQYTSKGLISWSDPYPFQTASAVQMRPTLAPTIGRKKRKKGAVTTVAAPKPLPPNNVTYQFSVDTAPVVRQTDDRAAAEKVVEQTHSMDKCACGFYAYYDGSDDYFESGRVSGVVEGYGETLIGTRGFRAMKARIVALHVPAAQERFRNRIARNYEGIPMFDRWSDMIAAFPPDGGEASVGPAEDDFWTRKV